MKFKLFISREHICVLDKFIRVIDAPDIETAYTLAEDLALDADMDCPEDIRTTNGWVSAFAVDDVQEV